MSLWTCLACSTRRAVGVFECPQCGAAGHEEGDTVSGPDGGQGQRHIPEAYVDQAPGPVVADAATAAAPAAAEGLQQAGYTPAEVQAAVAAEEPPPAAEPSASTS